MQKIILAVLALSLSACAHLTKEQCLSTHWQQVGFNDGAAGRTPNNLANAIEDCSKFQIAVDTQGYRRGWQAGLKAFCSPSFEQGKLDGSNGLPYSNILNRNTICLSGSLPLQLGQYQAGFKAGQVLYCTYDTGFTIGVQGKQPPEVCTGVLKARYIAGWEAGARQFCSNTQNAFTLGKDGQPYPAACPGNVYYAFKAEYDRGVTLRQKLSDLNREINSIDSTIDHLVWKWRLRKTYDARGYELGDDQSPDAQRALMEVKELMLRRENLQGQKNQLEVTR